MDGFIGYNPAEIQDLIQTLATSYETLGSDMTQGWLLLSSQMQTNWHGVDEQDYEAKLADRMCKLYDSCTALVDATIDTMIGLGESWNQFQNENRLEGGDVAVAAKELTFEKPTLVKYDMASVVKLYENSFEGVNLGIVSGAAQTIVGNINTYVDGIKDNVKNLYDSIDSSKAFLGNQKTGIQEFLSAVGEAIKAVATDVNDMVGHVKKLAGGHEEESGAGSYGAADDSSSSSMQTNISNVSEIASSPDQTAEASTISSIPQ